MTLSRFLLTFIVLAVFGYMGVHLKAPLTPPPLTISFPPQGFTSTGRVVEVRGETAPGALIEVNGQSLPIPAVGVFTHLLVLEHGLNTITVSARKRYSRPTTIERQVMILERSPLTHDYGKGI